MTSSSSMLSFFKLLLLFNSICAIFATKKDDEKTAFFELLQTFLGEDHLEQSMLTTLDAYVCTFVIQHDEKTAADDQPELKQFYVRIVRNCKEHDNWLGTNSCEQANELRGDLAKMIKRYEREHNEKGKMQNLPFDPLNAKMFEPETAKNAQLEQNIMRYFADHLPDGNLLKGIFEKALTKEKTTSDLPISLALFQQLWATFFDASGHPKPMIKQIAHHTECGPSRKGTRHLRRRKRERRQLIVVTAVLLVLFMYLIAFIFVSPQTYSYMLYALYIGGVLLVAFEDNIT